MQILGSRCLRQARLAPILLAGTLAVCGPVSAQELEPRAYAANPVGVAFLLVGWSRSTGAVLTDPTLPISDIKATVDIAPAGVGYTFNVAGKVAQAVVALPYAWADVSGQVFEQSRTVTRSGLADTRIRFAVNLRGNDAMGIRDFVKAPRRTIVGVSVVVSAPTGQYYADKLINIGTNRWAFKPEVGLSVPKGKWDLDAYLGTWLFAGNDDYFPGGVNRTQSALAALQGHGAYTFRPRLWLAADGTWYVGGKPTVGEGTPGAQVNNVRLGLTLSVPAGRQQSIKLAYSAGATVRTGTDFKTFSVGWSRIWLTKM